MRALTVRQPHARAIVLGVKRYETRTWPTLHRGPLVIHAAGRPDLEASEEEIEDADARLLGLQVILGVVEVVDCIRTEEVPEGRRVWGNFKPGRWAWVLENPKVIVGRPPRAIGQMGLWNWDPGGRSFRPRG